MEFTLQKLVQQTLAEAEHRVKVAQADGESCPECKKAKADCACPKKEGSPAKTDPSDNPSTAPERNEEGISEKTATVFVEKLAAAVQYLNENYLEKEAVGKPEPPTAHTPPQADKGLGAGKGTGAMETNLESPTTGMQSEETGQAKQQQIPTNPGKDVPSPGQTNTDTALETDMNAAPGGSEDWTNKDVRKQAGTKIDKGLALLRSAAGKAGEVAGKAGRRGKELVTGSKQKILETSRSMGAGKASDLTKEKAKVLATRAGIGALGAAGVAKGVHSAVKGKEKDGSGCAKTAQVDRILGIMAKMAADAENPASIGAKTTNPHQSSPEGVSAAGEGKPSVPGEVSKQESMIASNEAATNATKQQAKAVPKARMGEVLDEPAQKKSSDPVLHQNLDAAGKAGVKLSSVEAGAAARVLLEKIAEEGASADASPEQKERASQLQELLQAKQKESQAGAPEPNMPVGGGY